MITHEELMDRAAEEIGALFPQIGESGRIYRNLTPTQFDRPAAMVRITGEKMRCFSGQLVNRTAVLEITLFCPVDEYHNSDEAVLGGMLDSVMETFSAPGIDVGRRFLDIGEVAGEVQLDYAQVNVPLAWQDDRKRTPETVQMMERAGIRVC